MTSLSLRPQFQYHHQHLVEQSPWPLFISFTLFYAAIGAAATFHGYSPITLNIGLSLTLFTMILWFRDIIVEGAYLGHHGPVVQRGFMYGFILFVISEVFAFLSIFWAFLHSALSPDVTLGQIWPPTGITALDAFGLPLLNTIILLSSGAFLTIAHHGIVNGNRAITIYSLLFTIILAIIFTSFQVFEYFEAPFTFADSVYGSVFFASTGLHGLHVLVGTLFLVVALWRIINYNFIDTHMVGFEAGILYWHFVDVVWLFLWVLVYYWAA